MSAGVKRVLLVMMQPPGSSGVMGLIYDKLLPFLDHEGWELHFAGPLPELASVLTEKVGCSSSRLHYTRNLSLSLRFSVLKNRQNGKSVRYWAYAALQFAAVVGEKIFRHNSSAYLVNGLRRSILVADAKWNYDLIAGKSPDFRVLDAVADLASFMHKPLVAMIDDPHGKRDGQEFIPCDRERQKQVLDQCCGAVFMSPMTRDRYVTSGLVDGAKAYSLTDSFPTARRLYRPGRSVLPRVEGDSRSCPGSRALRAVHLGMLPEWRPIDALFTAFRDYPIDLQIDFYGYVYPEACRVIQADTRLRQSIRSWRSVGYEESHDLAEDSDVLFVVIGPRHLDNQPSKFFEYLGHSKPIIVLGPQGNPIQAIIHRLGIGVYCDILLPQSIATGIETVSREYESFRKAFSKNSLLIEAYSDRSVALRWSECLDQMLARSSLHSLM